MDRNKTGTWQKRDLAPGGRWRARWKYWSNYLIGIAFLAVLGWFWLGGSPSGGYDAPAMAPSGPFVRDAADLGSISPADHMGERGIFMFQTGLPEQKRPVQCHMFFPDPSNAVLSGAQLAAFADLQCNYPAVRQLVPPAALEEYRFARASLAQARAEIRKQGLLTRLLAWWYMPDLPEIRDAAGVEKLLGPPVIHIMGEEKDGMAFVELTYECQWNVDGMHLVYHGGKVMTSIEYFGMGRHESEAAPAGRE